MEDARLILNASFAKELDVRAGVEGRVSLPGASDMKWVMDTRISAVLYHKGRLDGLHHLHN